MSQTTTIETPTAAPDNPAERAPEPDEIDYFPLFWNSLAAALVALVASFLVSAYLAIHWSGRVEIHFWNYVVPYLAVEAPTSTFFRINRWSSLITAAILIVFSILPFLRRQRLQVQAGRTFAWLDVALIGFLNLSRSWWFDDTFPTAFWMYLLMFAGLIGFATLLCLVWVDYRDRSLDP